MKAVEYKAKGCSFLLDDRRVFVKTNLQLFLLTAPRYPKYIEEIREGIVLNKVSCIAELYGLMKHKTDDYMAVDMVSVERAWYE